MKKLFLIFFSLCLATGLFAEGYQIKNVTHNVKPCSWTFLGTTKPYAINQNVEIDKTTIFETESELKKYIDDYIQQLKNLRAFDSVEVSYSIQENTDENGIHPVYVTTELVDSMHLLGMPYGKYNSNTGTQLKLKVKDSNFLGTLNPLNGEFTFSLEQANEQADIDYSLGANFSYDYPFHAGIFDIIWINAHSITYTFGQDIPEFNLKTGIKFNLPKERYTLSLELDQFYISNFDYKSYGDGIHFKEQAVLSAPIKVYKLDKQGWIYYTPYTQFEYFWDTDGISNIKYDYNLAGPNLTFGHKLTNSRINWKQNLRTGLSVNLTNSYKYNFDRNILYPLISLETKAFKKIDLYDGNWFSRFGICADIYSYAYLNDYNNPWRSSDGYTFSARMRGIRDTQYYVGGGGSSVKSNAATIINLDFPIHIVETNTNRKFIKYLNFDLQVNPFMDIALTHNKKTDKFYDPKDGFYAAGVEVLVYPKKFKNYTVRGSLGVDVGRLLFADYLNMDWRPNVSKYEITVGLGLHY